jgi:hypothetical protein
VKRKTFPLFLAALFLPGCISYADPPNSPSSLDDCAVIAAMAREQYGWIDSFPLDREGFAPECDWEPLGVRIVIRDLAEPGDFSGSARLSRPTYWGRSAVVFVSYFNGIHLWDRRCRLTRSEEGWRLVEECEVIDFF